MSEGKYLMSCTQVQEDQAKESDFETLSEYFENSPETSMGSCESSEDVEIDFGDLNSLFTKKLSKEVRELEETPYYLCTFFEGCSTLSFNDFLFYNIDYLHELIMANVTERLCMVFNSKLLFQGNILFITNIPNARNFYPNPYFLKTLPIDRFFEHRIRIFRSIWWIGEKFYIKNNDEQFFSNERVVEILARYNINVVKKRICNKRLPIGDYRGKPDTRVNED